MLSPVVEHVRERMTGLARRLDDLLVIAIAKHGAATSFAELHLDAVFAIDVFRRRDHEALHATREGELVVSFDQQMDVRLLDADVNDAKGAVDHVVVELAHRNRNGRQSNR